MGGIRRIPNRLGILWVKCPLIPANKMAEMGKIRVKRTTLRIERLAERPLQYFKCLEGDHVAQRCPNSADHAGRYYRCGEGALGHLSRDCTREVHCVACADNKLPAKHRVGSAACQSAKRRRKGKLENIASPVSLPLPPSKKGSAASTSTTMSEAKRVAEKRKLVPTQSTDASDKKKTPKRVLKKRSERKSHSDLGLRIKSEPDMDVDSQ